MELQSYLDRIGFTGPVQPDLATLHALHQAHLLAIPYENLDVQLGRPVTIARPQIYEKIIGRHRGGWCYEMNGLFGWALSEIGFRVTRATGAVRRDIMGDVMVGNHLVLRVDLDEGVYLADVGFGDGSRDPIRVEAGPFHSHGFHFRLAKEEGAWWRVFNHQFGGAQTFDFMLDPADEKQLEERCHFLQTSEMSPFVQNAVCQRHTSTGLTILRGRVLRRLTPEAITEERLLADADDFVSVLDEEFDLNIAGVETLWPKIVARHEAVLAAAAAAAAEPIRSAG
jgi:N-hydroxyarylamine O-acetyltransferase